MISSNTHIIRQQVVDVSYTGDTTDGIALQQKIATLCTDELIPTLEKILNRYAYVKGHVYLDLLEIDLGTFQSDELELKLAEAFREKLEFLLTESSFQNLISNKENEVQSTDDGFRFTSDSISFADAFIHFLETGRLPWSFRLPQATTLNQVLREVLNGPERDAVLYKIKQSLHHPIVVRRMALQIEENTLLEILHLVSTSQATRVEKLLSVYSSTDYRAFRLTILEAMLIGLASENFNQSEGEILDQAIAVVRSDGKSSPQINIDQIINVARKHQIDFKSNVLPEGHSIQDRTIAPQPSHSLSPNDTSGLYIDNAGLILLHPFLLALFEETGIVKEEKIVDPHRALFLLHYLCTGQKEASEYDLTFSKIICGLPLDEPVPSNVLLLTQDIEEADAVLSAVIRHWSVLQHTSHDGLRGTFLLRHGKLSASYEGGWQLQVERQSVDILLDNLPWSISMIKFPWLPHLIHVEW